MIERGEFGELLNDFAECAVCWTDTGLRCSPCGDPVCQNCACPNGCDTGPLESPGAWDPTRPYFAANFAP